MLEPPKSSLDGQFPGNSNKEKERPRLQVPELSEPAVIKKESPFLTFYKAVFSGTLNDVKKNLWNRLVDVTKDTIYNTIVGFVYDYIYDPDAPWTSPPNEPTKNSLTNPERYWNAPDSSTARKRPSSTYFSVPEVTFSTREDAEKVLKSLIAYRSDFPDIPVSVYLAASGDQEGKTSDGENAATSAEYTDEDWGWFDLAGVRVVPVGRRFKLTLPRPELLPKNTQRG